MQNLMKKKLAVLIVTYGEVEDPTIKNLLPNSRLIMKRITTSIANIPHVVQLFISWVRSIKRNRAWTKSGYRSRLNEITRTQTALIKTALNSTATRNESTPLADAEFEVMDAYYFVPPLLEDALKKVEDYDGILIVPMVPVESAFACGVSCKVVLEKFGDAAFSKVRVLHRLWDDERLMKILVDHFFSNLPAAFNTPSSGVALAVHGTLVKDGKGNTPTVHTGLQATYDFFEKLKAAILSDARCRITDIRIAALNHKFGGTWMEDTLQKALHGFKASGIERVSMFPYGFFADNSEADFEALEELHQSPFKETHYIPCLNDSPQFAVWTAEKIRTQAEWLMNGYPSIPVQDIQNALTPMAPVINYTAESQAAPSSAQPETV